MPAINRKQRESLIRDHLAFIERQCERVLKNLAAPRTAGPGSVDIENETMELFNRVLDLLQKDGCKIVLSFSGRSKFTTYLSAIISRQAVDMIRRKRGRDRRRDRARQGDEVDRHIYRSVVEEERTLEESYRAWIKTRGENAPSWNEYVNRSDTVLKRPDRSPAGLTGTDGSAVFPGSYHPSSGDITVVDPRQDPAREYQQDSDQKHRRILVTKILGELPGRDRLILRMRFALGKNETPATVNEIARIMGLSPKSVYRRLSQALARCKKRLTEEGFEFHE